MINPKQSKLALAAGTLVASMAITSTVLAVNLIENDSGLTVQLKGDYELQLRQRTGENDNLEIEYDDLEIKFHARQDLESGMSIFGGLEADFKKEGDGGANKTLDAGWVGIDFGALEIGIGKTDYATDNFSVEADYEMGPGDGFDQFNDEGGDLVFGNYKAENFKLYFSTDLAEGDDGDTKDESSVDLVAEFKLANLDLAIGYQDYKEDGDAESIDTVGIRVKTKIGATGLGLAYTTNDTTDQIDVSLKYGLGSNLSGATGFSQVSPTDGEDVTYWYSNIGRSFTKNTKLFVEIGGNDKDDSQVGYLVGLRLRF